MSEIRVEVENGFEVRRDLVKAENKITRKVQNESINEFARELKEEIEDTAPVRTGQYKNSWEMEQVQDGVVLYNTTQYGKYLVFPNQKMVGVPTADDPGRGILHNVRGIVFKNRSSFRDKIKKKLQRLLAGS